jgi:O-succinylbenzoic acid--CoA ligase
VERGKIADLIASRVSGVHPHPGRYTVVDGAEPGAFMASFAHAAAGAGNVFLGNPSWLAGERAEAHRIAASGEPMELGWIMIPSGGAGGSIKFARHDGWTIASAVDGFCRHFGMGRVNSISVLPLHHVGGFMAWMRSALTGGTFETWAWKDLEAGLFPQDVPECACISLVPTQLKRLILSEPAVAWLRRFSHIFVGGGPAWEGLVETAARLGLPLSPCYGATETAAMVAALRPAQFLAGMRGCGSALPHARIEISDGGVRVAGPSIFRGYYPAFRDEHSWVTDDLGDFDNKGSLVIQGRRDDVVMTGGKKVSPAEVEAALRASGEFDDVAVIGIADPEWGQLVVACHPSENRLPRNALVEAALSSLAAFKHPKRFAAISPWPRNTQGKIDRSELARLVLVSLQRQNPRAS